MSNSRNPVRRENRSGHVTQRLIKTCLASRETATVDQIAKYLTCTPSNYLRGLLKRMSTGEAASLIETLDRDVYPARYRYSLAPQAAALPTIFEEESGGAASVGVRA